MHLNQIHLKNRHNHSDLRIWFRHLCASTSEGEGGGEGDGSGNEGSGTELEFLALLVVVASGGGEGSGSSKSVPGEEAVALVESITDESG